MFRVAFMGKSSSDCYIIRCSYALSEHEVWENHCCYFIEGFGSLLSTTDAQPLSISTLSSSALQKSGLSLWLYEKICISYKHILKHVLESLLHQRQKFRFQILLLLTSAQNQFVVHRVSIFNQNEKYPRFAGIISIKKKQKFRFKNSV